MVLCLGEKFWKLNHSSTEILIVIVAQKSRLSCSSFKGMTPMTQSPHTLSMASMGVCDTVLYKTSLEIEVKLKDDSLNRLPLFNSQCQWQKEIRGLSRTYSFIHFISIKYGTMDINFPRFRSDNIKFLHPKSTWTFRTFFTVNIENIKMRISESLIPVELCYYPELIILLTSLQVVEPLLFKE